MRSAKILATAVVLMVASISIGCLGDDGEDDRVGVIASILPQKEMLETIGGEHVDITVMVPPGSSPHDYEPLPSQLAAVSRADVYFSVGSGIEFELQNLEDLADQNEGMMVVNTSAGIDLKRYNDHHHGDVPGAGEHLSGAIDPHVWTSPSNLLVMASNVLDALVEVDPGNQSEYRSNHASYVSELQTIDLGIEQLLSPYTDEPFLVYHPAWGYFSDDYGLVMLAIEEEGREPGPAGVAAIIEQANDMGIDVVFVSPQFDPTSAEQIAQEIGGEVITIDPLAEELMGELLSMADTMAEGWG